MTLTEKLSFSTLLDLFKNDARSGSRSKDVAQAESYQQKIKAAKNTLENELPNDRQNWIKHLDC